MTEIDKEIVELYEQHDMDVADIGVEMEGELAPETITMCLAQHSNKFQRDSIEEAKYCINKKTGRDIVKNGAEINNVPVKRETILKVMETLMQRSDNDMVKARIAIYLHEEVTGRNEKRVKQNVLPNLRENVLALNDKILQARKLIDSKVKMLTDSPMIVDAEIVGK